MTDTDLQARLKAIERIPSWTLWWMPVERRPSVAERQALARKLLVEDLEFDRSGILKGQHSS